MAEISFYSHLIRAKGIPGARADFEDMIIELVGAVLPDARSLNPSPGDWGIDVFVGRLSGGEIDVWQSKFFIDGVSTSQRQQIRDSFAAVCAAQDRNGFHLRKWTLCIPCSMDTKATQWWDKWSKDKTTETGISIELWDATHLRRLLNAPESAHVRRQYYGGLPSQIPNERDSRNAKVAVWCLAADMSATSTELLAHCSHLPRTAAHGVDEVSRSLAATDLVVVLLGQRLPAGDLPGVELVDRLVASLGGLEPSQLLVLRPRTPPVWFGGEADGPIDTDSLVASIHRNVQLQRLHRFVETICPISPFDDIAHAKSLLESRLSILADGHLVQREIITVHAIGSASVLYGRGRLTEEMLEWLSRPGQTRTLAIVGMSGLGKSSLVHRVIQRYGEAPKRTVLVWGFYFDSSVEELFDTIIRYRSDRSRELRSDATADLVEALRDRILVLDGLEVVQSQSKTRRRRGALESVMLRDLLRTVASLPNGPLVLMTSQLPLVDLEQSPGHRHVDLDALSLDATEEMIIANGLSAAVSAKSLHEACGGHTLAIAVAVKLLAEGHELSGSGTEEVLSVIDDLRSVHTPADKLWRLLRRYCDGLSDDEERILRAAACFDSAVPLSTLCLAAANADTPGSHPTRRQRELLAAALGLEERNLLAITRPQSAAAVDIAELLSAGNATALVANSPDNMTGLLHPLVRGFARRQFKIGSRKRERVRRFAAEQRAEADGAKSGRSGGLAGLGPRFDTPALPQTAGATPRFRYSGVLAQEIELRWQDWWDEHDTFHTANPTGPLGHAHVKDQPKLFVLDMFPYPNSAGMHVGQPSGFIGTDIYSRFHRMTGKNVLYTMGFDAFGLPAEQYAVQTGQHPAITTDQNIANIRKQLRRLGLSHDTRRSISTTDPGYYRWTQWIFTQIFNSWYDTELRKARPIAELVEEFATGIRPTNDGRAWGELSASEQAGVLDAHRLAYIRDVPVNWCPGLGTVVGNEEVTSDGRSDRGNFPVFKRNMRQWMMRITAYADRLVDDLDLLDWTESIKAMQRNWIGRSDGLAIDFECSQGVITVFTTRPDMLFGATFLLLAPEHPLVDSLVTADRRAAFTEYRRQAALTSDVERQFHGTTGVFTGAFAKNPATGESIPVWVADFVLAGFGTGAIMSVPCRDDREFKFARHFGLEIRAVQVPPASWYALLGLAAQSPADVDPSSWPEAFNDAEAMWPADTPATLMYVNSANDTLNLNGISDIAEAKRLAVEWLLANGHARLTSSYKLRDWLFSRQRYWGEPLPIVFDEDGHAHALPDELLPLEVPPTDSFSPRTFDPDDAMSNPESPLDRLTDWVWVELDLGDGPKRYKRDTNVMPQWAASCWYQLRYCDPTNADALIDPQVEQYWMGPQGEGHPGGVDLYVGGVEHAVLHLLYARFWHKVLFDLGHVSSPEPYRRLFNQGFVLSAAFKDERDIYVDALSVQEQDGRYTYESRPVTREWGRMGRSLKNTVALSDVTETYGADTLRLYEMAMGPLDATRQWETRDVVGMYRFLQRVWRNLVDEGTGALRADLPSFDYDTDRLLHRTIEGVNADMGALRFNTAIAKLIEFNNHLTKLGGCPREAAEDLVLMLAPLAPHIAEELWRVIGHNNTVAYESFPTADQSKLVLETVELPVQINGKVRARITVPMNADAATVQASALAEDKVRAALAGAIPRKVVVVPGRTVSIVV